MADGFETFSPPVSASMHPTLAAVCSGVGFSLMALFFAMRGKDVSLLQEVGVAAATSFFMGFGVLFSFLTVGLWV